MAPAFSRSSKALSYYATPGARAIGSLGTIPNEVDAYGGLTMAERALMPDGHVLEPKTFAQAQYRNDKWGVGRGRDGDLLGASHPLLRGEA